MAELGLVVFVALALGGLSFMALLSVEVLLWVGAIVFGVGFVVGVSGGIAYHIRLYRTLSPRGQLSRGWLWKPYRDHVHLREEERKGVLIWWYLGGIGFLGVVAGGLVGGIAVVRVFIENAS